MTLELLKLIAAQVMPDAEVSHLHELPSLIDPVNTWAFQIDWIGWKGIGTIYFRDFTQPATSIIRAELERMQMSFTRLSALQPNPSPNTSGSGPTPRP